MIHVLMLCMFMSGSGETCMDQEIYNTLAECEASAKLRPERRPQYWRCEARRRIGRKP